MPQYISIKGLFSSKKNDLTLHWYNYRTRCNLSRVYEHGCNKIKRKPTHIYKKCLKTSLSLSILNLTLGLEYFQLWAFCGGNIKSDALK